jgi:hypothetical protein
LWVLQQPARRGDAFRRKARHHILPAHGRRHLPHEGLDARGRLALRLSIHVGHDGDLRVARGQRAQLGREPRLGRLHQGAVERRAHWQGDDAPGAARLRLLARARDGRRRPGDHDLAWRVQVGGADDLTVRCGLACLADAGFVEAEHGRHGAGADRHRFLHVAAPMTDDADGVGEIERPGSHVRRVLAEAVPRHELRAQPFGRQQAPRGDAHGEDGRLCVLGERQLIGGAVEDEAAQRLAQRRVGLGEGVAADGKPIGQRAAHADRLRPLAGEEKGNHR